MRIVFFGTPAFAVPSLTTLADSRHSVVGVVTQPDRPRGRGQKVSPSPVKAAALDRGLPVLQPDRLRDSTVLEQLRHLDADLGVVAAYGKILPAEVLAWPRLGLINVHASLLPRWRGAAPIHRAILAGDTATGITIMRVVQALDAGPMLRAVETPIEPNETSAALESRLALVGADLVRRVIDDLESGHVAEAPQDETLVTYASRLTRADSILDFSKPALDVHNAIRGLQPWPLATAMLEDRRVRLLESSLRADETARLPPGTITKVEADAFVVSTGRGAVAIGRLQLDGRPVVSARDFLNGHAVKIGDRFLPTAPAS
jgi:methionyl-tRNA formyltransferase